MNTNRDYVNYVTRHTELLNQILNQMENLNTNMFTVTTSRYNSPTQGGTTSVRNQNRPYSSNRTRMVTPRTVTPASSSQTPTPSPLSNNTTGLTHLAPNTIPPTVPTTPTTTTTTTGLTPLINNMINSLFWEPIAISATQEQIDAATSTIAFEDLPEAIGTCPITMEPFTENSNIVQINRCGHCFSRRHLNRWFHNHVTCPVCRHDIRENNTVANYNLFGTIGNDVGDPEAQPAAGPAPQPTAAYQPLTYQFDITMNTQDLLNGLLQEGGTGNSLEAIGNNSTNIPQNSTGSGYSTTYYNFPYPPNNRGSSL